MIMGVDNLKKVFQMSASILQVDNSGYVVLLSTQVMLYY